MLFSLRLHWLIISSFMRKTYKANVCGHRTNRTGITTSFGETIITTMPLAKNGKPDYCLECIGKMAIKCAVCESPIHIGDPITLYTLDGKYEIPKHAVRYDKDPQCFIGCLHSGCSDSGINRQGFWVPPGKVERVPSPIDILMADKSGKDKMLIIEDLSNPNDHGRLV